jgi:hypothetical protein
VGRGNGQLYCWVGTYPRKIRVQFYGYKHTSLILLTEAFSKVSLKSKNCNFLRSRPSISAMLDMRVDRMTRRQVGCLPAS